MKHVIRTHPPERIRCIPCAGRRINSNVLLWLQPAERMYAADLQVIVHCRMSIRKHCIPDCATHAGMHYGNVRHRLKWRAMTTPFRKRCCLLQYTDMNMISCCNRNGACSIQ